MNFIDELDKTLKSKKAITENGAISYRTTGKELLDFNFAVSSMRKMPEEEIQKRFAKVFYENRLLALKYLFYLGDCRGGLGERRSFNVCMEWLVDFYPSIAQKLLRLIPEYTRWDNLSRLVLEENKNITNVVIDIIKKQLNKDIINMENKMPVSLCAKWLQSENASSSTTKFIGKKIREGLGYTRKEYQHVLSALRKCINVTEVKMCANEWNGIDYEEVPSKANLIYRNAFLKHDKERRSEYLKKLKNGEVKINSSVNFPHDIVHRYSIKFCEPVLSVSGEIDSTLEGLWKALPDTVLGDSNTLVIRDGSGSMTTRIGNSNITALEVATALTIYFAERSLGAFKDKFITFSANPALIDLSDYDTLYDKLNKCYTYDDCSNTNIEKTFDLILVTAINAKMKQEDMPKNILIVSDMEFDDACRMPKAKKTVLFDVIKTKFEEFGYKMPRLIFWNINSRTNTIPMKENKMGVALVSGFSVNTVNMVLSGKLDPYECLLEQLNSGRYKPVEELAG